MKLNGHYRQLSGDYLFAEVGKRVAEFQQEHPDRRVIRLGIGDVTQPLCPPVVKAMQEAAGEQLCSETFHGYGPEQGYLFLREAIIRYYQSHGVLLDPREVFISDGAKSDLGNFLDLFGADNTVLIPDPVYPVYRDTNQMDGRRILYMQANKDNSFLPMPDPDQPADLIYLCSPNNPTGAAYTRRQLEVWVDYAIQQDAVLLFDAAYEAFVTDPEVPHSIYEIRDAQRCAAEFCSLSKTAGFTGIRCGYTVVPQKLIRGGQSLRNLWLRRQTTKFNGVSYPVQRAAEAVFTDQGSAGCRANRAVYQENARVISEALSQMGIYHVGGKNSPYIWLECPGKMDSWSFFEDLLCRAFVVGTPGAGFGANGEGFFRLTAFGTPEDTREAMDRMIRCYGE